MIRIVPPSWPLTIRPVFASLLLFSAAVGLLALVGLSVFTLIPLVVMLGVIAVWSVTILLIGWGCIEALAACERWMEQDPRFQR